MCEREGWWECRGGCEACEVEAVVVAEVRAGIAVDVLEVRAVVGLGMAIR